MRKWEIGRYTLTQLEEALSDTDPDDLSAGTIPIPSLSVLDEFL
jgi:hypothetical protein